MIRNISTWALVLSIASHTLASPLASTQRNVKADLVARQFACPPGLECGPGPECTIELCDLPGCADADVCQYDKRRSVAASLVERQGFGCPDGIPCGHGPECAGEFCSLAACADAEECQGYQDKKRNAVVHPVCDICIVGDDGVPVCGCATAGGRNVRRATDKICPLFCITTDSGEELCGCAAEDYEKSLQGGGRKA